MKKLTLIASLLLAAGTSYAACFGSGALYTCTDNSGNTYNVNRIGNSTYVQGNNAATGSRWNQSSQQIGNSTYTQGQAANGNTWNSTTQRIGNSTYTHGTDSRGNAFQQTCNQFGCR